MSWGSSRKDSPANLDNPSTHSQMSRELDKLLQLQTYLSKMSKRAQFLPLTFASVRSSRSQNLCSCGPSLSRAHNHNLSGSGQALFPRHYQMSYLWKWGLDPINCNSSSMLWFPPLFRRPHHHRPHQRDSPLNSNLVWFTK